MKKIIYFGKTDSEIEDLFEMLEKRNIAIEKIDNIAKGVKRIFNENYSLVLIYDDIDDFDTKSLTYLIKESNPDLKIVLISSKNSNEEHLYYLQNGIIDYIPTTYPIEIICEKIYINAKREIDDKANNSILESAKEKLKLNAAQKVLTIDNEVVHLSFIEFDILEYLMRNKNKTVSREEILNAIWTDNVEGSPRIIDTYIKNIRKKTKVNSIVTIRSMGYQWLEY